MVVVWTRWHTPITPALWEPETGGSKVQAWLGRLSKTLSENKKIKDGLGMSLNAWALGSISKR